MQYITESPREIFEKICIARGLTGEVLEHFLRPAYSDMHDPFLLPDMRVCVDRLLEAHRLQQKIVIYGDYDIDGLTATTVLLDAFKSFGFLYVESFIPNRFVEGYGLTLDAVALLHEKGADLVVTVDCGSLSHSEIARANELGMDIIVTDHHNVAVEQPAAIGVINPKRLLQDFPDEYDGFLLKKESKRRGQVYPFLDLAGVGVAFKVVQALQTRLSGLAPGQEKWLLDLVALGTVCDIVSLIDENRVMVFYGLKVLARTRRKGLIYLMKIAQVPQATVSAQHLGFAIGPRMNAAGRLDTARHSLDMLLATTDDEAQYFAENLDALNQTRRKEQDDILKEALVQAEERASDAVLVLADKKWNHGIIGIVAAKILERYKKPTFVLQILSKDDDNSAQKNNQDIAKGSARSFGDFSAAEAIRSVDDLIIKGGGHAAAAGVTLLSSNIALFRERINAFYRTMDLQDQAKWLLPKADISLEGFEACNEELLEYCAALAPFGAKNPEILLHIKNLTVAKVYEMGADKQHIKLTFVDKKGESMSMICFNAPALFHRQPGELCEVWCQLTVNEFRGNRTVEAFMKHLEVKN